jgi:hypothetical protein
VYSTSLIKINIGITVINANNLGIKVHVISSLELLKELEFLLGLIYEYIIQIVIITIISITKECKSLNEPKNIYF